MIPRILVAVEAAAIALLLVIGLAQTYRLHSVRSELQDLKTEVAQASTARATAAAKQAELVAQRAEQHATDSVENDNALLDELTRQRDAAAARAADADRLRLDAERRAATYRAMSEAGSDACRSLADHARALDGQLVEGIAVVGGLAADLERRDAEVAALIRQRQIDAAATAQ